MIKVGSGIVHFGRIVVAAKQKTNRRLIARTHHVLAPVVEIEIHLSRIGVLKRPDFKIEQYMATEQPVIENQIDIVVFIADCNAFLASFETEARPQLQQKLL